MLKTCKKCNKSLDLNNFYKDSRTKDSKDWQCKSCRKRQREACKEHRKEWAKNYRPSQETINKQRELQRKNYRENKDRYAVNSSKRRSLKVGNGGSHTPKEWIDLLEKYNYTCLCCGATNVKMTKDHIVPISKGGRDDINNIQPLCITCNISKHTRIIDYR